MIDDLNARFVEVKLAGTKESGKNGGYLFRSNEGAAEIAIGVVKKWLLDQADQTRHGSGELVIKRLADSLDRSIWTTPWYEEQIVALARYQTMINCHPYTCGNNSSHPDLVPSQAGWFWSHAHNDLLS